MATPLRLANRITALVGSADVSGFLPQQQAPRGLA